MGELIGGIWQRSDVAAVLSDGVLKRPPSIFRNGLPNRGLQSIARRPADLAAQLFLGSSEILSLFCRQPLLLLFR
jgi:hypothetical protein